MVGVVVPVDVVKEDVELMLSVNSELLMLLFKLLFVALFMLMKLLFPLTGTLHSSDPLLNELVKLFTALVLPLSIKLFLVGIPELEIRFLLSLAFVFADVGFGFRRKLALEEAPELVDP